MLHNEPSSESWSTRLWDSSTAIFYMQAKSQEKLRIDIAVLDQKLTNEVKWVKSLFPDWVDVIAYSSFMSTYTFWIVILVPIAIGDYIRVLLRVFPTLHSTGIIGL